jgi:hypothetical protein
MDKQKKKKKSPAEALLEEMEECTCPDIVRKNHATRFQIDREEKRVRWALNPQYNTRAQTTS